jgi:DNA-binding transcriptional LysR family regulator
MISFPPIQSLRCFAAVAQEGTVSAAALKLHISQPAVSLQIKNLEEMIGLRLFERTPQGLVITQEGKALLPEAEAAISALKVFNESSAALNSAERQTLRIGTILDPDFIGLGMFLSKLMSAAPKLETLLRHGMSDDALAQIARRELDVGFYLDLPSNPAPTGPSARNAAGHVPVFRVRPLRQFTYRVAAPPGWMARVRGKGWKALAGLPWLATPQSSAHRRFLDSIFNPLGVVPQRVATTDQESSMLDLLKSGVGLSLVRDEIAEREARAGNLVIAEKVAIQCVMSFVCLEERVAKPPIAHALSAIEEVWPPLPVPAHKRVT